MVQLLHRHPHTEIIFATARSAAGQPLAEHYPTLIDLPLIADEEADPATVDVAFLCLPHGAAAATACRALEAGARVIDLSADFRLHNPEDYLRWYNQEHPYRDLLREAVYGLPELHREQIRTARLVANPGCYPTSVILALVPLVRAGLLDNDTVIVDSKSGISGAGRGVALKTHFGERHENFSAYSIGRDHRHIAEMEQETGLRIIFSPHMLPVFRGILSTMYVQVTPGTLPAAMYAAFEMYANEPFVHVLPEGRLPELRHAVHTNHCVIGLQAVAIERGEYILISVEDNLIKGASGQALQNMNLMFGLDETTGLL
ncbi:MAG: N-acetyl-gamma-glutamyl-phosphate reductase [Chloroflexaceae bacterium]|nr:N-acetyl-gamma-glutamyl-phosphate reductase [Chloroflexaceae bacterium]